MSRSYLDPPRPIVALATVPGSSALALLRASGEGSLELLAPHFSRPEALRRAPGHSLVHGRIVEAPGGRPIDDVLVAVFRPPSSPTGEEQVEISCHGSPLVVRRLLSLLEEAGFAPALPGEFSFRAFANGKADLVESEAIAELVAAPGEAARQEALVRLGGALSRRLGAARSALLGLLAEAEVRLDYAEEDGSPAELFPRERLLAFRGELAALASTWRLGKLHTEGLRVVIAGSANAGKSSLFNLLVREERALVSPEPGTTRDWIESGFELEGLPVRLVDTAGLREEGGAVEVLGMERSRRLALEADIVICLADGSRGLGAEDRELLAARPEALRVWNKVDLPGVEAPPGWIGISALEGRGLPELLEALRSALRELEAGAGRAAGAGMRSGGPGRSRESGAAELVIASPRQKALLDRAVAALDGALAILEGAGPGGQVPLDAAALELRDAADAIGELTGEIASPEILEAIFSGFCLGK